MTSRWSPGLAEMDIPATAVRERQVKDRVLRPRNLSFMDRMVAGINMESSRFTRVVIGVPGFQGLSL